MRYHHLCFDSVLYIYKFIYINVFVDQVCILLSLYSIRRYSLKREDDLHRNFKNNMV